MPTSFLLLFPLITATSLGQDISYLDTSGDGSYICDTSPSSLKDYAVLTNDPISEFPESFTICSSISSKSRATYQSYFLILDEEGKPWITLYLKWKDLIEYVPYLYIGDSLLTTDNSSMVFVPSMWYHACMSLNASHVVLVINGKPFVNGPMNQEMNKSRSLANKLFL